MENSFVTKYYFVQRMAVLPALDKLTTFMHIYFLSLKWLQHELEFVCCEVQCSTAFSVDYGMLSSKLACLNNFLGPQKTIVCMLLWFWCTGLFYLHLIKLPFSVKLSNGPVIILMYPVYMPEPTMNLNYQFKFIEPLNTHCLLLKHDNLSWMTTWYDFGHRTHEKVWLG
jgi:hypothetical protein